MFGISLRARTVFIPLEPENADRLKLRHRETNVAITFKPTDFTQVNHVLNELMVSRALRLLKLDHDSKVVDFFCGLGNFTLPIADKGQTSHRY